MLIRGLFGIDLHFDTVCEQQRLNWQFLYAVDVTAFKILPFRYRHKLPNHVAHIRAIDADTLAVILLCLGIERFDHIE